MADELHRRIDWYFNAKQYVNSASIDDAEAETMKTTVSVFQGRVTASARRAAGIEGKIHFIGQQSKTRLDRRHHAVDASVIAMMNTAAAQTLMERESLRESQRLIGLMPGERSWKEYPYEALHAMNRSIFGWIIWTFCLSCLMMRWTMIELLSCNRSVMSLVIP